MAVGMQERGLRRRLVLMGLGLRPGDVREVLGWRGNSGQARVSYVLSGEACLKQDEAARVAALAQRRLRRLFEQEAPTRG